MLGDQAAREKTIARIFLDWLRGQDGVELELTRAEDRFPELANRTRWEFVAERKDGSNEWIGLEVKGLFVSHGERQANDWRKLIGDVNGKLVGKLPGKYWLTDLPMYDFSQKQRQILADCLARVIQRTAPGLEAGDEEDIGPDVADLFTDWPVNKRKQPHIGRENLRLYPPHELVLRRTTGEGNSVGMGASPITGYWVEPALNQAVRDIFKKHTANEQLRLAKIKGASTTALLFDERIDFDPKIVTQAISTIESTQRSGIDEVYLVSAFSRYDVERVWPENS